MANDQNLVDITSRPQREQRAIQSQGGKVRSPGKKIAARLRELKKKGLTDATAKILKNIMFDSDMSALEILVRIQGMAKEAKTPKEQGIMNKLLLDWHKMHHGSKDNASVLALQQNNVFSEVTINIIAPEKEEKK